MTRGLALVLSLFIAGSYAQFNPSILVDSCTKNELVVSVIDAVDGGIVYIQGQGVACKQTTTSGTNQHTFNFGSCNIQWEESFKIVIQQKAAYQTGNDKQIPIMCLADLNDLTVANNINAADKDDDAGQNKTVKPTATMALYKDGVDISGSTVKLTDVVTMLIQLDDEYIEDFDIKAKDCTASTIDITTSHCAADTDLFPHFTHVGQGILSATFGAFRTTDLNGGSVPMTFSCSLQVCLGSCSASTCADGTSVQGRKKRQASDDGIEDISVGSMIEISAEEVVLGGPKDDGDFCMNTAVFVIIIIVLTSGLVVSGVSAGVMTKKVLDKASLLKQLGTGAGY